MGRQPYCQAGYPQPAGKKIDQLRHEIDSLKEHQRISDEEYRARLNEVFKMYDDNDKLVNEMAEEYSKIDYDLLNDYHRQMRQFILKGELSRADSLIQSRGSLYEREQTYKRHKEAHAKDAEDIARRQAQYEANAAGLQKEMESLAQDYYYKYERFKLAHQMDSAANYLEKRSNLDPTNVDWLLATAIFVESYLADAPTAIKLYNKAYNLSVQQDGAHSWNASVALNDIGVAYISLGKHDSALVYLQKVIKTRKKLYGANDTTVAHAYLNMASTYHEKSDDKKALEYASKALKIYKLQDNMVAEGIGDTYIVKEQAYRVLGKLKETEQCFDSALTYLQQSSSKSERLLTALYNDMAGYYCEVSNFSKAKELYEQVLKLTEKEYGEYHPATAIVLNNIGGLYSDLREDSTALSYKLRAMEIMEHFYGTNHPESAATYNNVAATYSNLGKKVKALQYMKKALAVHLTILGENSLNVSNDYYNISCLYSNAGNYKKGLEYAQKALPIAIELAGESTPRVAKIYNQIATIYYFTNDCESALSYNQKSLDIYENNYGEMSADVAIKYSDRGVIYQAQNNHQEAIRYFKKSIELLNKIYDKENPFIATAYENVSTSYFKERQYDSAFYYLNKALAIKQKAFGEYGINCATNYYMLALMSDSIGNNEKMLDNYQKYHDIIQLHPEEFTEQEKQFSMLMLYNAYTQLLSTSPSDKYSKLFDAYLQDKMFICRVTDTNAAAAKRGYFGVHYLLEFCGIPTYEPENLPKRVEKFQGKPKDIVFYDDKKKDFVKLHFENIIGAYFEIMMIDKAERARLIEAYHAWRKNNQ